MALSLNQQIVYASQLLYFTYPLSTKLESIL